jgi:hypothetical protein
LSFELTDIPTPYSLKAVEYKTEHSDISGDQRVVFGSEPLDLTVPFYKTFRVKTAVAPPLSYIIPAQWNDVIELLKIHGLELQTIPESQSYDIESYRFIDVSWPSGPFEGRLMPQFQVERFAETRDFPAGSVIVPTSQPLGKLALNLLEPEAPDSLLKWGFFNAVFEQKEYGEHYVLETLARAMLEEDETLRKEFKRRLGDEPEFAGSPSRRLEFFYRQSPYWDPQMNLYPVGRLMKLIE